MSLDVAGEPILSQGELIELVRGCEPSHTGTGLLQAWALGEDISAAQARVALDIDARASVTDPQAHDIIDRALTRLDKVGAT